jgi:magnesium transporter
VLELPGGERRIWLRLLPPDDAADLIQMAPEERRSSLVEQLDPVAHARSTRCWPLKRMRPEG